MLDTVTSSIQQSPIIWASAIAPLLILPIIYVMYGEDIKDIIKVYLFREEAERDAKKAQAIQGKLAAFT